MLQEAGNNTMGSIFAGQLSYCLPASDCTMAMQEGGGEREREREREREHLLQEELSSTCQNGVAYCCYRQADQCCAVGLLGSVWISVSCLVPLSGFRLKSCPVDNVGHTATT